MIDDRRLLRMNHAAIISRERIFVGKRSSLRDEQREAFIASIENRKLEPAELESSRMNQSNHGNDRVTTVVARECGPSESAHPKYAVQAITFVSGSLFPFHPSFPLTHSLTLSLPLSLSLSLFIFLIRPYALLYVYT